LKADRTSVLPELAKSGFKVKNVHYLPDAFQLDSNNDGKLLKTSLADEGKIYLQSLSSQIPAFILEPKENEKILDMAASPGSKTTQIAAMMRNTGSIDAVEPDFVRMERLMFNVKTLGATNVTFFKTDGADFCKDKTDVYDRVLADVPCSGEGRFSIYDRNSYGRWKPSLVEKLATLQKKLLRSAILSVKPGGIVVYSTCTLNAIENEKNIDWALKQTDFKIKIIPVSDKFKTLPDSIEPIMNFRTERYDNRIKSCLRILPSENLEGFFICKIQRVE
jgi:16S rRNA (cytosine1407-C5)-methyltransferase